MWVREGILMMVVGEGSRHVLMRMVLHRGHCAVMGEEGISRRGRRMRVVRRPKDRVSCPWRLILHLTGMLVGGELVGNARGLLRVVHGIGGESRHSEDGRGDKKVKRRREND